jgi:hypothetical protein
MAQGFREPFIGRRTSGNASAKEIVGRKTSGDGGGKYPKRRLTPNLTTRTYPHPNKKSPTVRRAKSLIFRAGERT